MFLEGSNWRNGLLCKPAKVPIPTLEERLTKEKNPSTYSKGGSSKQSGEEGGDADAHVAKGDPKASMTEKGEKLSRHKKGHHLTHTQSCTENDRGDPFLCETVQGKGGKGAKKNKGSDWGRYPYEKKTDRR